MFNVLEIHRMTTHNGPGYRTCVHLMGCPLNCRWCSTPESRRSGGLGFNRERCIGCGSCVSVCPSGALLAGLDGKAALDRSLCNECCQCTKECCSKALWKYGSMYSLELLKKEILKDRVLFTNSGGGVTFSGGECLMNVNAETASLFKQLHEDGVTICVDTCGYVPWNSIEMLAPYINVYLWDIKHMDTELHKKYTGVDNRLILQNLSSLSQLSEADIYIRVPLIPGISDTDENIASTCRFLKTLKHFTQLHFLPYHHMGQKRYEFCGQTFLMEGIERQSDDKLSHIRSIADAYGIPNKIVG